MIEYNVQVYANGNKYWYLNGNLHREDGPAVEGANGTKHWYLNGKLHREDGPAFENSDGNKYWYLNGKLHREDGPAVKYSDGEKYWYLNGEELTKKEFKNKIKKKKKIIIDGKEIEISEESWTKEKRND
jgi:hypothetical protein